MSQESKTQELPAVDQIATRNLITVEALSQRLRDEETRLGARIRADMQLHDGIWTVRVSAMWPTGHGRVWEGVGIWLEVAFRYALAEMGKVK